MLSLRRRALAVAAIALAVENDMVVPYDMEMTYGSPSGQIAILDVIEKALR